MMGDGWRFPRMHSIVRISRETDFINDDSEEISVLNPVIYLKIYL